MARAIKYSVIFGVSGFALLLALHVVRAIFELPPLMRPFKLQGTAIYQAEFYAGLYVGFAEGIVLSIAPVIVPGMVGSALGFLLTPRNLVLRRRLVVAAGGMFAVTTFFLSRLATQAIGEILWLVSVVAIAGALSYASGRVFSIQDNSLKKHNPK